MVPQDFRREVGAFQMLRPWDVDAIDMLVYCLQTMNFLSLPLKHLSSFYQRGASSECLRNKIALFPHSSAWILPTPKKMLSSVPL